MSYLPTRGAIVSLALALVCCAPLLAAPQDRYFDSAGTRIHYVEEGAGQPVILLHGYASNATMWIRNGVFTALTKSYRVVAVDCRGHGASDKPHEVRQYGREMGRDVIRLLDVLRIDRAHLIGYSMGAQVAAQVLAEHQERFRTGVLGGASGRWAWSTADEKLSETEATEMEERMLRSMLLRLAPAGTRPTEEEVRGASARRLQGLDTVALAAVRRSMRDTVVSPNRIAALKIPVLGIVGSADPALSDFRELKKLLPSLQFHVVAGASHVETPTRPEYLRAILEFLAVHRAV